MHVCKLDARVGPAGPRSAMGIRRQGRQRTSQGGRCQVARNAETLQR